jgi:parvulin-like peptidyl-prolyl isomerase
MDEGPLVASVGGRPVTKAYYETRLERMDREFLPDTLDLAGKREFLDFIINKELMALKAEEMGVDEDPQLVKTLKMIEDNAVYKQAVDRLCEGKIDATEEEIQAFYEAKKEQVLVKHILLETLHEAQDVYQKLQDGADFDQMVQEYSIVPAQDTEGLSIPLEQRAVFGWVEYGRTQPWVEEAIFNGELNKPLEPLQTAYGWHIFMPVAREPKRQSPLAEQRENIATQIKMRKRRVISEEYYENILKEKGFELERSTLEFIYDMLPEDLPPDQAPDPNTEVKPVIPFSIADRTKMLMKVGDKKYTVGDFSDEYDDTSWFERPKRNYGSMGLYYWIRNGWLKPLQLQYAYDHGVADDPVVVAEVSKRREQMMVNYLHQNLIGSQVPEFSEEELREFYENHLDVYVDKEKRVFNLIFHPRERVVRRAYDIIKNGGDFVETAIRFNDNATEPHHVQTPAFARDDPDFAEIAEVGWSLDLKEMSEPFKTDSGWVLLQYALNIPEQPFEFETIREFVERDMKSDWSEKRLNTLLAEWKQQYDVEIYDDVLADAEVRRDDVVVPGKTAADAE